MKILLRESKEFGNFKSGKYLRDGKWVTPVAYNLDEGWVIVRITAVEYAEDMGCNSVEELMADYSYDAGIPEYIYLGYDLELSQEDDGEGESAVVGIKWEDSTYAHYGVGKDNDHTTFDNMVKAIVVNGLDSNLGDYSASKNYVKEDGGLSFLDKVRSNLTFKKMRSICREYGYELSEAYWGVHDVFIVKFLPCEDKYYPEVFHTVRGPQFVWGVSIHDQTGLSCSDLEKFITACRRAHDMIEELSKIDLSNLYHESGK